MNPDEANEVADALIEVMSIAKGLIIVETVRDMLQRGVDDQTCAAMADRLCKELNITHEQAWEDWKGHWQPHLCSHVYLGRDEACG